jgi:arabinofuranosyltransferase
VNDDSVTLGSSRLPSPRTAAVRFWAVGILISLLGSAIRLVVGPLLIDDAYIYFRYALDAAMGKGLVYNPGQWVFGATSPAYTFILVLASKAGLDLTRASVVFGIALDFFSTVVLLAIGRKLGTNLTGWLTALLFSLAPKAVIPGLSGMETSLFTLLIILSFACLVFERSSAAIILAGLAGATRPEGLALLGVILVYKTFGERKLPWRETLVASAPIMIWLTISRILYGEWIPNSINAKATVFPPYPNPFHDSILIVRYMTNPFEFTSTTPQLTWVNLIFVCLGGIGLLSVVRRSKAIVVFLAWSAVIAGSYAVINRSMFPWYLGPLFPTASVLLACAVGWFGRLGPIAATLRRLSPHTTTAFQMSALLVLGLGLWSTSISAGSAVRIDQAHREATYLRLGEWLAIHLPAGDTVGSAEIGAIGYGYPGPILDYTGLVSPEVLPFFAAPDFVFHYPHTLPAAAVERFATPVLVTYDKFIVDIRNTNWFKREYPNSRVLETGHPVYGTLMIFTGPGVPIPPAGFTSASDGRSPF